MLHPLECAESLELPCSSHSHELCVKFISQAGLGRPQPHSSPSVWPLVWVTAPVNWEQQMVRQSYQAHSTTLKSCITKLKSSGARFWNSHLSKFTLNKKGALFTLSFHSNTNLCVQAIRLPEEIQQLRTSTTASTFLGSYITLQAESNWGTE